ncbi:MAG: response regulator [Rhodospirillaceae bacterium]|nr:response regulator [Rhodospirillaceae bacterium]
MPQNQIVCIVDDDDAVRDSLQVLLETMDYAVKAYESGPDFLEECTVPEMACVLLDVRMPKMNGMEVQQRLHDIRPALPVIIVTGHADVAMAVQAMQTGAIDFIEKPFQEDALLASVRNALSIGEQSQQREEIRAATLRSLERLTHREREVFDQLILGHANKVIARALDCSPRTVEIHRARVMEKLDVASVAHLVRMALAVGIEFNDG